MLYLMGFDLLTGVFMLTPLALLDKRPGVTVREFCATGAWCSSALAGALGRLHDGLVVFTYGFHASPGAVERKLPASVRPAPWVTSNTGWQAG
jgi:hypothetical protein